MKLLDQISDWCHGVWDSMKEESQRWHYVCPKCGFEKSVWEMGGIRWKAAGNPRRLIRCQGCGKSVWARVEYREPQAVATSSPQVESTSEPLADTRSHTPVPTPHSPRSNVSASGAECRLWIDGVGCWRLWWGDALTIGGGTDSATSEADLVIQAPLSRKHAMVMRSGDDFALVPLQQTTVEGREVTEKIYLGRHEEFTLGGNVRFKWEVPHELSHSGRLTCVSAHRPADRTSGLILVSDTVLLGPGSHMHIPCPRWSESLVLFRRQGGLWCRPLENLLLNGTPVTQPQPLPHGSVLTGPALSLRVEVES